MEYILQTDNLSKVYGEKTVLDHVSIHVPKKSIYGLVGKNGAGKTTLMRIVCGLAQQSEGSYTLLGKTNDNTVRSHMGMLIEKPGIYGRALCHGASYVSGDDPGTEGSVEGQSFAFTAPDS